MALVSNANTLHERCIEYLLNNNAAPTLNATQQNDLDANHDGVINMDDLTTIINMELCGAWKLVTIALATLKRYGG